jgi:hypothetical protein
MCSLIHITDEALSRVTIYIPVVCRREALYWWVHGCADEHFDCRFADLCGPLATSQKVIIQIFGYIIVEPVFISHLGTLSRKDVRSNSYRPSLGSFVQIIRVLKAYLLQGCERGIGIEPECIERACPVYAIDRDCCARDF